MSLAPAYPHFWLLLIHVTGSCLSAFLAPAYPCHRLLLIDFHWFCYSSSNSCNQQSLLVIIHFQGSFLYTFWFFLIDNFVCCIFIFHAPSYRHPVSCPFFLLLDIKSSSFFYFIFNSVCFLYQLFQASDFALLIPFLIISLTSPPVVQYFSPIIVHLKFLIRALNSCNTICII